MKNDFIECMIRVLSYLLAFVGVLFIISLIS